MSDNFLPEDAYVARQPIFDRKDAVIGYELLYRSDAENTFPASVDPDGASSVLIDSCLHVHDLQALVGNVTPFINITENLLCNAPLDILPKGTVLQLDTDVQATPETFEACRRLKAAGCRIALDNFRGGGDRDLLVDVADVLKINFMRVPNQAARRMTVERYSKLGKTCLADKVETHEDAEAAKEAGYMLFQGFFYSEPKIEVRRDIPRFKQSYVLFLQELRQPVLDRARIERLISNELSLSVRLLKYMNSCAFGLRQRVSSIGQALVYLGEQPLRRWGSLVAIAGLGDDRPQEIVVTTLTRARFCELLGDQAGMKPGEPFLLGLVSCLDALLGRPRDEVLMEMGVSFEIIEALNGSDSGLGKLYAAVCAYEHGDWEQAAEALNGVFEKADGLMSVPGHYRTAVAWAQSLMDSTRSAA